MEALGWKRTLKVLMKNRIHFLLLYYVLEILTILLELDKANEDKTEMCGFKKVNRKKLPKGLKTKGKAEDIMGYIPKVQEQQMSFNSPHSIL